MSEIGVNKTMVLGHSGGDADLKFTPAGTPVVNFSLAINESFKTRDGQKVDRVEWSRCVCWNKLGEIAGQYVTRGKLVFVWEGRLQTRKYDDRDGNGRTVTEFIVMQLRLPAGRPPEMAMPNRAARSVHKLKAAIWRCRKSMVHRKKRVWRGPARRQDQTVI